VILETTFLVDLEREEARGRRGAAQGFLEGHAAERLFITLFTAGELAAGVPLDARPRWAQGTTRFEVLPVTADVCWEYGQAYRFLKNNGLLIGANDLWTAATAVAFGKPVVTRNVAEFRRVPGVEVLGY
jgi:tRNA(fMet)-specific endonuclease VapC